MQGVGLHEVGVLGMLGVQLGGAGGAYYPTALYASRVALWKLDEASDGSGAVSRADSVGSNTLTDNGTTPSATGLVYALAADLEVSNSECFTAADNAALSMADIDFWLEAWVKLESKGANRIIMAKGNGATDALIEFVLGFNQTADRYRFAIGNGTTSAAVLANTFGVPALATWHHLLAWHNATLNTINIRVNGGAVDSASYTGGSYDSSVGFALGAILSSGTPVAHWDGLAGPCAVGKNYIPTDVDAAYQYNGGLGRV